MPDEFPKAAAAAVAGLVLAVARREPEAVAAEMTALLHLAIAYEAELRERPGTDLARAISRLS
jgi:hypothetical protein